MRRRLSTSRRLISFQSVSRPNTIVESGCSWSKIGPQISVFGRTCLVVVGDGDRASGQAQRPLFELRKAGINCAVFTIRGVYPAAESIDEAREMAKRVGAASIVGIGPGGAIDTAKATAKLHTTSGPCKVFLESPGSVLLSEGSYSGPRAPEGDQLPLVMVPSSAGAGTCANDRCLVWHPEDEVLVPMAEQKGGERRSTAVALVDPSLCMTLSKEQTVAMALTALSSCFDALIACELGSTDASPVINIGSLEDLSLRGIAAIGTALPKVLEREDIKARELLSMASLWAGQLSSATPAPPTQLVARAAGSLLCRHSYPSVCAAVLPHVIRDIADQAESYSCDLDMSETIGRALSQASRALLGEGSDTQALLSWLEAYEQRGLLEATSLSTLDSTLTAKELVTNVEQLLALERDGRAADRLWSGEGVLSVAERAVG